MRDLPVRLVGKTVVREYLWGETVVRESADSMTTPAIETKRRKRRRPLVPCPQGAIHDHRRPRLSALFALRRRPRYGRASFFLFPAYKVLTMLQRVRRRWRWDQLRHVWVVAARPVSAESGVGRPVRAVDAPIW